MSKLIVHEREGVLFPSSGRGAIRVNGVDYELTVTRRGRGRSGVEYIQLAISERARDSSPSTQPAPARKAAHQERLRRAEDKLKAEYKGLSWK